MTAVWGCVVLLIIALVPSRILAQNETATPPPPPPPAPAPAPGPPKPLQENDDPGNSTFVVGNKLFGPAEDTDGTYDIFRYEHNDYLFVGQPLGHKEAAVICEVAYHGQLAIIKEGNGTLARFLAEALSETNLVLDALWTAGVRKLPPGVNPENATSTWYWEDGSGEKTEIEKNMTEGFVFVPDILNATDRDCLTFARKDHNSPQYQPITCHAKRPYLCVRPEGSGDTNGSTHPGWIKLGMRLYKIFDVKRNYEDARKYCVGTADPDAELAVVTHYNHSQQLGRYLLIGRPSLENGWLGAKWIKDGYQYEPESYPLSNNSDKDNFPPWRGGTIQKVGGCVLLDRHIANITLFVEARCERLRPIICYKMDKREFGNLSFSDIIIGEDGYRIIYNNKTWEEARDFCKIHYGNYSSKLVEINGTQHVSNLLYAMGENRTAIQHIWIGGKLNTTLSPPDWVWDSDNSVISKTALNWVKNDSYTDSVEASYVCLNMDRENHLVALHYGTRCATRQPFVCWFTKEKLEALEQDEMKSHDRTDDRK